MSTDTPKYKWLNEQEFHELCMDYRGASPLLANDCYIRLQEFIVSQLERELAAETEKVKRLREALELSLRYGMTKNDLADAHLLDKNAPLRIVSATL